MHPNVLKRNNKKLHYLLQTRLWKINKNNKNVSILQTLSNFDLKYCLSLEIFV